MFYWKIKGGLKVDFVLKNGQDVQMLIQVSWNVQNKKTRLREERSLRRACKEFGLAGGMILTEDVEKIIETDELTIRYYPLWKWLLGI